MSSLGLRFIKSSGNPSLSAPGSFSHVGPQGPKGDNGLNGPQGAAGATGVSGSQGAIGATGTQGLNGPQGTVGKGFVIFSTVPSYSELCSSNPSNSNIGEFVLITGGDLFIYMGTGLG